MPSSAKCKFWAKVFRQDILELATDAGNLIYLRGKTEGPGIFRTHDGKRIDFIPRSAEGWINKRFHCDKIAHFIGYAGKSVAANFEMITVLSAHETLQEYRNKIKALIDKQRRQKKYSSLSPEEMDEVLRHYLKTNPEAKELMEKLKLAQANAKFKTYRTIQNGDGTKSRIVKERLRRLSVLLIDPRILGSYIKDSLQPSQARYVHDVGYQQGVNDTNNPMAKMAKYLVIFIIIIIPVAIIALLLLGGSGA